MVVANNSLAGLPRRSANAWFASTTRSSLSMTSKPSASVSSAVRTARWDRFRRVQMLQHFPQIEHEGHHGHRQHEQNQADGRRIHQAPDARILQRPEMDLDTPPPLVVRPDRHIDILVNRQRVVALSRGSNGGDGTAICFAKGGGNDVCIAFDHRAEGGGQLLFCARATSSEQ